MATGEPISKNLSELRTSDDVNVFNYESFWQAPQAASVNIMWLGQLFAIMCLSSQFQQLVLAPSAPSAPTPLVLSPGQDHELAIATFQAKSVECLILGHYTKGGPYVLETLILYFLSEIFPLKEVDVDIWMLVGTIVQVAMHMGYHRDAAHFPQNITPFAGEMRRRVWSMVVQLDFSISTQLGLPRLVSQANTAEPRNLADSDFDESTAELPPSRPQIEVTPILYTLAKLRIISVGIQISDLTTEPRTYPYNEVLHLDQQINEAMDSLPSSMKWEGLSSSLTATSLVLIQRIWLNMCIQRLKVVLHKKFLVPSSSERQQYAYSRSTCLAAAMRILEFQHLIDEETRPDGRLYQIRWRVSTAVTQEFLLATSVLCLYLQTRVQNHERHPQPQQQYSLEDAEAALQENRIRQLLQTSMDIWLRLSAESTEARRAAEALRYVLRETEPFQVALHNAISGHSPAPLDFQGFVQPMPNYNSAGVEFEGIEDFRLFSGLVGVITKNGKY
ncbi:hypothetical protein Daus18300_003230 [Diaporthe australafricana]|uniref:Xylanolytic transcriptional activator regulatory domain-containing protein n=1 Tax=Diaporthe australafricana TaxID=127596 RepID=A0ABR3XGU6_9PEZI